MYLKPFQDYPAWYNFLESGMFFVFTDNIRDERIIGIMIIFYI